MLEKELNTIELSLESEELRKKELDGNHLENI